MTDDTSRQKKQVAKLRHGTVIDHLSPGMALKALELIGKKFKVIDDEFGQIETLYGVGYRYKETAEAG